MHVIAKMNVVSIEDFGSSKKIKFQCVHDNSINTGDNEENRSFTKATPWGEAAMTIDNKNVWPEFRLASDYNAGPPYRQASGHFVAFIDAEKYSYEDIKRALASLEQNDACAVS